MTYERLVLDVCKVLLLVEKKPNDRFGQKELTKLLKASGDYDL